MIMPTRGRPELASVALRCALGQNYAPEQMEIIIFDDDDLPSFSDPPQGRVKRDQIDHPKPLIRYFRHPRELFPSLGDKRNAMCEESRGDIIVHIDSDDLSAPGRISSQVNELVATGKDISGFHTLPFYDISTGQAYVYHLNSACVCGTSLVYRRDFWQRNPFPSTDIGEDLPYTSGNRERRISSDGRQLLVALLHDGNMSSRKQVRNYPTIFPRIPAESLPEWFQAVKRENNWQPPEDCGSVVERYQDTVASEII